MDDEQVKAEDEKGELEFQANNVVSLKKADLDLLYSKAWDTHDGAALAEFFRLISLSLGQPPIPAEMMAAYGAML